MGERAVCRHCHPKGHLFKLGLILNPICERYMSKDETASSRILCDCEALPYLIFRDLGHRFTDSSAYKLL
jgi:hypothetical protein